MPPLLHAQGSYSGARSATRGVMSGADVAAVAETAAAAARLRGAQRVFCVRQG